MFWRKLIYAMYAAFISPWDLQTKNILCKGFHDIQYRQQATFNRISTSYVIISLSSFCMVGQKFATWLFRLYLILFPEMSHWLLLLFWRWLFLFHQSSHVVFWSPVKLRLYNSKKNCRKRNLVEYCLNELFPNRFEEVQPWLS